MLGVSRQRRFGRRRQGGSLIIALNGRIREYKFHPVALAAGVLVLAVLFTGFLASTAYLAFRDDLLAASLMREVRMKRAYEDRIANLRAEVDRITSRQLLDQQAVEAKVATLIERQEMLSGRSGKLESLFQRARESGFVEPLAPALPASAVPVPVRSPQHTRLIPMPLLDQPVTARRAAAVQLAAGPTALRGSLSALDPAPAARADNPGDDFSPSPRFFGTVLAEIETLTRTQEDEMRGLHRAARKKAADLEGIMAELQIPLAGSGAGNVGGPFLAADPTEFDDLSDDLSSVLDRLDDLKERTRTLPIGQPVPGARISSRFGSRVDPFFRKTAFHAGIDYRATAGTPVRASGGGTVVKARRNGGYGLLVVIDHGDDLTSRYAHLSRILVRHGQKVKRGTVIGRVGSTGRSTGPHLHYEVRRAKKAANPARFLKAGRKLNKFL